MKLSLASVSAYKRADAHLTKKTAHGALACAPPRSLYIQTQVHIDSLVNQQAKHRCTAHGISAVTIFGILLGITLGVHETRWYWSGKATSKMAVDLARRHDLPIHMDISFPSMPCAGLSVDVMDASGSTGNDANHAKDMHLHKMRLNESGRRVKGKDGEYVTPQSMKMVQDSSGSVMQVDLGASMSQMSDIEEQLARKEGCRLYGDVLVRRVAGKIHLAVHQQSFVDLLPQMLTGHALPRITNMSHVIHKVAFGPEFPGQVNPLDGFMRMTKAGEVPRAYKYYLKIVPTEYLTSMGTIIETNQYSISEFTLPLQGYSKPNPQPISINSGTPSNESGSSGSQQHKKVEPTGTDPTAGAAAGPTGGQAAATAKDVAIDFSYDLSPIVNTISQTPAGLLHYLVRMCAVVGGVISLTRMADIIVHGLLVRSGVVVMPASSKSRHGSGGGSYPGSARNSLPGDAAAYISGAKPYGSYPVRSSSAGMRYSDSTGGAPIMAPGSHPLSRFNSGTTTPVSTGSTGGMVSVHSSMGGASSGQLYSMGSSGSLGGAVPNGGVVGDAISMNGVPVSTGISIGGAAPSSVGQVSQLLGPGSGAYGAAVGQGLAQRHSISAGGAPGSPLANQAPLAGAGGSRLAAASGPMGSGAFGSPARAGAPGQFGGQQHSSGGR